MKHSNFSIVLVGLLIAAGCGQVNNNSQVRIDRPEQASYAIDGKTVKLENGKASEDIPGSAAKIATSIFEATAKADVDKDGRDDTIVILTQNSGGSGTFFYAAVALNTNSGYVGSNAILLGDRIAPQSVSYTNGVIQVNYATRKPNENFTIQPSVGVTKYLEYSNGELKETLKR